MAVQSQKLRTLYVMKILLEKTDERNPLSAQAICDILKNVYSMDADRKSIYSDADTLQKFGIDVIRKRGTGAGYYIGHREYELPELKLLVDAVQASKFITEKKSRALIQKLEKLCSRSEAKQLQRQVYIYNRLKAENETIYYNVDQIHNAIYLDRQIQYHYCQWNTKKELVPRRDGAFYRISPWMLCWDDENYYLIGYDAEADCIKHYRVDKMRDLSVIDEKRKGETAFQDFDLAAYAKKTFGMYGGKECTITLRCPNDLAGVIIDRFGHDVWIKPDLYNDPNYFRVDVAITVSPQFFGWLTGIGSKLELIEPDNVREEYVNYLAKIMETYRCEEEHKKT